MKQKPVLECRSAHDSGDLVYATSFVISRTEPFKIKLNCDDWSRKDVEHVYNAGVRFRRFYYHLSNIVCLEDEITVSRRSFVMTANPAAWPVVEQMIVGALMTAFKIPRLELIRQFDFLIDPQL